MGVRCTKAVFGTLSGAGTGTVSLGGCTPGSTIIAGWVGGTASRALDRAVCDGVAMDALIRASSGANAFYGDVYGLEGVQTDIGAVTITLNAPGAGDLFVLALTPSVLLEVVSCLNAAAVTHASAPPNRINTPAGAFLLSLILQDVGARLWTPAPFYTPQPLTATVHLLQTREAAEALTGERAIATTNAPTDSQGVLLAYGPSDAPEPPEPTPGGGPPRIFGSPIFGG